MINNIVFFGRCALALFALWGWLTYEGVMPYLTPTILMLGQ